MGGISTNETILPLLEDRCFTGGHHLGDVSKEVFGGILEIGGSNVVHLLLDEVSKLMIRGEIGRNGVIICSGCSSVQSLDSLYSYVRKATLTDSLLKA
jgi:hypothetical protein